VLHPFDLAQEHVGHIVEGRGHLLADQSGDQGETLAFGHVVEGGQIQRPGFGGELADFDLGDVGERAGGTVELLQPVQVLQCLFELRNGRAAGFAFDPVPDASRLPLLAPK
jgi:hypothetical protein